MQTLLILVAPSARLMPFLDVLTALGPVLETATIDVLNETAGPIAAAEAAIEQLAAP